jgi:hypothetical protein
LDVGVLFPQKGGALHELDQQVGRRGFLFGLYYDVWCFEFLSGGTFESFVSSWETFGVFSVVAYVFWVHAFWGWFVGVFVAHLDAFEVINLFFVVAVLVCELFDCVAVLASGRFGCTAVKSPVLNIGV